MGKDTICLTHKEKLQVTAALRRDAISFALRDGQDNLDHAHDLLALCSRITGVDVEDYIDWLNADVKSAKTMRAA